MSRSCASRAHSGKDMREAVNRARHRASSSPSPNNDAGASTLVTPTILPPNPTTTTNSHGLMKHPPQGALALVRSLPSRTPTAHRDHGGSGGRSPAGRGLGVAPPDKKRAARV